MQTYKHTNAKTYKRTYIQTCKQTHTHTHIEYIYPYTHAQPTLYTYTQKHSEVSLIVGLLYSNVYQCLCCELVFMNAQVTNSTWVVGIPSMYVVICKSSKFLLPVR